MGEVSTPFKMTADLCKIEKHLKNLGKTCQSKRVMVENIAELSSFSSKVAGMSESLKHKCPSGY